MRTRDRENRIKEISPRKKKIRGILFVLYILSFLSLIICRYMENYYSLDFSRNSEINYYYGYPIFIILSLVFASMLRKRYKKRIHFRSLTILILILIMKVPYIQYARQVYLNENIELYESAIEYTLNQDNGKYLQEIELPIKYDKLAFGDPFNYSYIIKDENATKIYFEKGGFYSSKGYLYVIPNEQEKKEELKENYYITYRVKKEMEGFWTWVFIYREDLRVPDE